MADLGSMAAAEKRTAIINCGHCGTAHSKGESRCQSCQADLAATLAEGLLAPKVLACTAFFVVFWIVVPYFAP